MPLANPLTVYRGDYRYLRKREEVACLIADAVGDIVCIRGDLTPGGRIRVERVDPTDIDKMPAYAILTSKSSGTIAEVQKAGDVIDVFTGMVPGRLQYVGKDGKSVTHIPPTVGTDGYVVVQPIGLAVASNILRLSNDTGPITVRRS